MCVWLPHWPLQATLARQPDWKDHPLVLFTVGGRGGFTVVSRSRKADAVGVKPGMPLAQARALLDGTAPPARFQQFEPVVCRAALEDVAIWCLQFSPVVGIEEADVPETVFLDIAGCDHVFGGEAKMAELVVSKFTARDLSARVAVADTIGAAWAVAHCSSRSPWVVAAGQHERALQGLPVEALRIDTTTGAQLRQLGIETIRHLQALPRETLPSRFGPELVRRLDQALGHIPELVRTTSEPVPIEAEQHFLYPTTDRHILETALRQLIEQVVTLAVERNQGIQQLVYRFVSEQRHHHDVTVRLLVPTVSARRLFDLARLQLDNLRLAADIDRVQVRAAASTFEILQMTLFGDASDMHCERELTTLVERLSNRLGAGSIVRPQWTWNPQPEFAIAYRSVLEPAPAAKKKKGKREQPPALLSVAPFRPLDLFPLPEAIDVVSVVPDGPPLRFFRHGREYTIARCWGPERIETGWWRDKQVRRDYYRVESRCGHRFWLFRQIEEMRWFLHGIFS
jgi:protein ImuB